jgi:chemotaxis protein MotA
MEFTSVLGLVLGIGGILLGNVIEGGHIDSLIQFAAAVIVLFGTAGAVITSSRRKDLKLAGSLMRSAFRKADADESSALVDEIMDCARLARKDSILAIEARIPRIQDEFMQGVMKAVVDGLDPKIVREIFEQEISIEEENLMAGAKVWTDAGGFAPTVGIIGAVLGLIHVMSNLADTSKLGAGIAVAFVATIYGVGFANLVFLPISNKIKKRISEMIRIREMVLEGGLAILAGLSPVMVEVKLKPYIEKQTDAQA